jgi:hypothetical protein
MGMQTKPERDITVLEFGQLEDAIDEALNTGQRTFSVGELATRANLTDAKVHEAMVHLCGKHDYITERAGGEWHFDVPGEDDADEE